MFVTSTSTYILVRCARIESKWFDRDGYRIENACYVCIEGRCVNAHTFSCYTYCLHSRTNPTKNTKRLCEYFSFSDKPWSERVIESEERLNCREEGEKNKSILVRCMLWLRGNLFDDEESMKKENFYGATNLFQFLHIKICLERTFSGAWDVKPFSVLPFDVFLVHLCQSMLAQLAYSSLNGLRSTHIYLSFFVFLCI